MAFVGEPSISVVISTFERPEACERALRSVLGQEFPPIEVLVCDNGSLDDTPDRLQAWEQRCESVRYLRTARNSGTPATTRNLGIEHARGDWIAFLDDDDQWLPAKLARQREIILMGMADVIATNALRHDGSVYFPDAVPMRIASRADILKSNPIIMSSAVVRRSCAGFPTERWASGVEDYAAWLNLADGGARFAILGEPLVRYDDVGAGRFSAGRTARQVDVARLALSRARRWPPEARSIAIAVRRAADVLHVAARDRLPSSARRWR